MGYGGCKPLAEGNVIEVLELYGHFPKRYSKQKRINVTFECRWHVLGVSASKRPCAVSLLVFVSSSCP